jgi:Zn-dependent peptidase ImmA (M78 family)
LLDIHQLNTVRFHADRLLRDASAIGRFPTPIEDLLAAAKVTVVDDEDLDEGLLRSFLRKAQKGMSAIKSALSKVLGLFDARGRFVVIDKNAPKPRIPFLKLHEAGHGMIPHQSSVYEILQDCKETLDLEVADLFEREANVFASEVLFQGEHFSEEAHSESFGIKVPMGLAKKYGASIYATVRRYVTTNPTGCCLIVLELPIPTMDGNFIADVRRVITSKTFEQTFGQQFFRGPVTKEHPLGVAVPAKKMTFNKRIRFPDRNGDHRTCNAEGFNNGHQILILLCDHGPRTSFSVAVPHQGLFGR